MTVYVCISWPSTLTGLDNVQVIFVTRNRTRLCTKYFKYSYILMKEVKCKDLMKIKQIIVEIWAHLFSWISVKIATLRHHKDYYFCIVEDATPNYHPTKFGNNCKKQCGNMDKTVRNVLTGGQKPAFSLRMCLHRKLIVDIITKKHYLLQQYTWNAWNALICIMWFHTYVTVMGPYTVTIYFI